MASFFSEQLEEDSSWWIRSQLIWRVFFSFAIVAVVVRTVMDWCKTGKCGFIISHGQENYSLSNLFPMAIIGVIGGLVGALFNQLTLYIIAWHGKHLHKRGAEDSRCEGHERIRYTRDQLLQLGENPQAATPPFLPSANDVIPMATYQAVKRKKLGIPKDMVGVIIGKGGETIKYLTLQSGAKIQLSSDMEADPNSPNILVELRGTPNAIATAEKLINEVLARQTDEVWIKIPNDKVGLVIGKGGETIKSVRACSGAQIQVIPLHFPSPGDTSTKRTLKIVGTPLQIESAKHLINQVIAMSDSSAGYSKQSRVPPPPCSSCNCKGIPPAAAAAPPPPPPPPMQQNPAPSVDGSTYNFSQPPSSGYNHPGLGYDAYNAPPQSGYGSAPCSYGSSNPPHQGGSSQIAIAQQSYGSNYQPQFGSLYGHGPLHWLPHSIYAHSQSASTAGGGYGHSAAIYLPAAHPPPGFDGPPQAPPLYGNTTSYGAVYTHKPSYASVVANGRAPQQGDVAKVKLH